LQQSGVLEEKCYGCGRCISVCPLGLIEAQNYASNTQDVSLLLSTGLVDGLEIHTGPSHLSALSSLWQDIAPAACGNLKVLSVSFPKVGDRTNAFLNEVNEVFTRHPSWAAFQGVQVWQADGRPMSGDIGRGTAHAAASLAASVLQRASTAGPAGTDNSGSGVTDNPGSGVTDNSGASSIEPIDFSSGRHFVQLAGGTNDYSVTCAAQQGLVGLAGFGGYAFGGYARKYISGYLNDLEREHPAALIEDHPEVMRPCLDFARQLTRIVKGSLQ
jgi:ferredoxin